MERKQKQIVRSKTYLNLNKAITKTNEVSQNPVDYREKIPQLPRIKKNNSNGYRRKSIGETYSNNGISDSIQEFHRPKHFTPISITKIDHSL
ncbi:hypothetical protein ENUP19_0047G0145 [Entamoeba nuttalli]|uniref:Uncharacterized protein n=1 Tax=Entamoeba nuttalli TaxID=412467 RepID=A0ABQ0DB62_9EUKA